MLRLMLVAMMIGVVSAVNTHGAQAPSPKPLAFEVASVKRSPPDAEKSLNGFTSTISVATPGGRWRAQNVRLPLLIQFIYGILPEQLVGGPPWMNVDRFTIEAKAAGEPSRAQSVQMVKQLLADRFKLRIRTEKRPLDAYVLVVARADGKLGPGLRPARIGCEETNAAAARGVPRPATPPGQRPPCAVDRTVKAGVTQLRLYGLPISRLLFATNAGFVIGRPVLDRTGLRGSYDIDLDYVPEGDPQSPSPDPNLPNVGSSLETAVREQLGLKFERRKELMEVLVIDTSSRRRRTERCELGGLSGLGCLGCLGCLVRLC